MTLNICHYELLEGADAGCLTLRSSFKFQVFINKKNQSNIDVLKTFPFMENMLKYDFMKYRHRLLYYRVAPIYTRYTLYITKKKRILTNVIIVA
jgi:hypothetical protein